MGTPSDAVYVTDYMVSELENVDIYAIYNQLLVITDYLQQVLTVIYVILALIVFFLVARVVINIFKNI